MYTYDKHSGPFALSKPLLIVQDNQVTKLPPFPSHTLAQTGAALRLNKIII
jgi:hypothetical protein